MEETHDESLRSHFRHEPSRPPSACDPKCSRKTSKKEQREDKGQQEEGPEDEAQLVKMIARQTLQHEFELADCSIFHQKQITGAPAKVFHDRASSEKALSRGMQSNAFSRFNSNTAILRSGRCELFLCRAMHRNRSITSLTRRIASLYTATRRIDTCAFST